MSEAGSAFERPIRIEYRPSPRMLVLFAAMHLGAVAAVALTGGSAGMKACIAALVAAVLLRQSRQWRSALRDTAPPILQLDAGDQWRLLHDGRSERMSLGTDCLALPGLIVLHLRDEARANRFFILAPDNAPRDALRRLRVRLRYPIATGEP